MKYNYHPSEKRITIEGIQCLIYQDPDDHGFWQIHIDHPSGEPFGWPTMKPYMEHIVRGAVDRVTARDLAANCIRALKDGCVLCHDVEGRIKAYKLPRHENMLDQRED